ncbi:MAG: hypothetical protein M1835_007305 [Candelina submexicana]|nr:MAG: hypothetical protein M1835_007305 [Candelina submexicana]
MGDCINADNNLRAPNMSTQAIHADDHLHSGDDVAPAMHVSTNFNYSKDPAELVTAKDQHLGTLDRHVYSRETAPNTTRLEAILCSLLHGHAITYSSGLSAVHAAYIYLNPKRVAIGGGYHGCHGVLNIHTKLTGLKQLPLDCDAEELYEGDVIHLESPLNPTGEAYNIAAYAEKAHSRGAYLFVDSTFGPPGLQDPFLQGADVVMHSGTKYLGGHSDMLCGVLAVQKKEWHRGLLDERTHLGNVLGSFEGWLGVRSLRTLELRIQRQSKSASAFVAWLDGLLHPEAARSSANADEASSSGNSKIVRDVVEKVAHASLQHKDKEWLEKQMPNGYGPVFAIWMKSESFAKTLPSKLQNFHHATSLGGVESLIEWRAMSDSTVETTLVRVSVGVENWEDLRDDLMNGFKALNN